MSGGGKALVLSCCVMLFAFALVLYAVENRGAVHVDPLELASLSITAAALVVTGVGVFVGLLAFIGYREILRKAEDIAIAEAARVAREVAEPAVARHVTSWLDDARSRISGAEHEPHEEEGRLDPLTEALLRPADEEDDAP